MARKPHENVEITNEVETETNESEPIERGLPTEEKVLSVRVDEKVENTSEVDLTKVEESTGEEPISEDEEKVTMTASQLNALLTQIRESEKASALASPTPVSTSLPWPIPREHIEALWRRTPTWSGVFRALAAEGYTKTQISKATGKLYQHVRNVLAQTVMNPRGAPMLPSTTPTTTNVINLNPNALTTMSDETGLTKEEIESWVQKLTSAAA